MSRRGCTLKSMVVVVAALPSWSCGGTAPSAAPGVAAIVVSPATSTLALEAQLPLQAEVRDGSGAIVTDAAVTWTVQEPEIVSISPAGVVKALAVGTSQVAANALGKSGIAVITVAPPTTTGPANPGNDDSGNDDSGNDDSGNDDPVEDDPGDDDTNGGDSSGGDSGDEDSGDEDSGDDTPSNDDPGAVATVTVTAPSKEMRTGSRMQLTAKAKDAQGNPVPQQSFVWSSSNPDKATVSETGVLVAKEPGSVTITARTSSSGGKSGSVKIQIKRK
jgi:hypothetical protein